MPSTSKTLLGDPTGRSARLTLAHLDAALRGIDAAERFLADGAESALAARGVSAVRYHPT